MDFIEVPPPPEYDGMLLNLANVLGFLKQRGTGRALAISITGAMVDTGESFDTIRGETQGNIIEGS
jgi:hypothetical protein